MNLQPLLAFIRRVESGGDYNIVWGGIRSADRPKSLTKMTVGEVLAWQDSIDAKYMSEAAGAYQIMEDTLRGLHQVAGVPLTATYDRDTQDKLAIALLKRRGLDKYLSGRMSATNFGNSLAKEWAGLPVVSGPKRGRSYYDGDGLNSTKASVEDFLAAIEAIHSEPERRPSKSLLQLILEFLRKALI